jgi:predicted dehydrogenase/predicted transcriptional regulator
LLRANLITHGKQIEEKYTRLGEDRAIMDERVGVAVIGAGYWGTKLVTEYLAAEEKGKVKLVKVCDPSISALGALLIRKDTASLGQERLTQDISEVLNDPEISAVHVATPNPTHYETAKMALEAGKHVLVEKPMTLKSRESYDLLDLARARSLVLHVGHVFRFNAALRLARKIVERGDLGKIFYARVQWTDQAFFPDRDIIFDLGPHPVDILNQLLGSWPQKLSGMTRGYRGDRGEVAYIIGEFPNDIFAHVELSWLHPGKAREVTLVGSTQSLVIDCLNQRVFRIKDESREELPVSGNNTIESEIDHFVDSIVRNDVSSESGLIGAHTVEVLETIRSSMWDKPLPMIRLPKKDSMNIAIEVLQRANQNRITSDQFNGNLAYREKLALLLQAGLIKRVMVEEGIAYEITDAGSSFLDAFGEGEPSLGSTPSPVPLSKREQSNREQSNDLN